MSTDVASAPVPLDTVPISPDGGSTGDNSTFTDEQGVTTVFHNPEHFNVKHPLMHTWTLWFTKPPSSKDNNWADLLKEVISFDSVEEFWGVYNNITSASELALKSDYHLFKQGIRPEWEDNANKHGGKWAYQYKEKSAIDINSLWLHVMLAAIGETLEDEDDNEVQGVVVNVRKGFYRIGLWTRTIGTRGGRGGAAAGNQQDGKEVLLKIGRNFKKTLGLGENDKLEFSGHTDAAHAGSTRAKPKHVL